MLTKLFYMWLHWIFLFVSSCQFVVKDTGDYAVHLMDPDVLVDWDKVEQVVSDIYLGV